MHKTNQIVVDLCKCWLAWRHKTNSKNQGCLRFLVSTLFELRQFFTDCTWKYYCSVHLVMPGEPISMLFYFEIPCILAVVKGWEIGILSCAAPGLPGTPFMDKWTSHLFAILWHHGHLLSTFPINLLSYPYCLVTPSSLNTPFSSIPTLLLFKINVYLDYSTMGYQC